MEYGDGEKDGDQKLWRYKDLVELAEQLMDILIDFILLHFLLILWNNFHNHKYVSYH
jgi:hypothetical protein